VLVGGTWWMQAPHACPAHLDVLGCAPGSGHTLVNDRRGSAPGAAPSTACRDLDGATRADWSAAGEALYWYLRANELARRTMTTVLLVI